MTKGGAEKLQGIGLLLSGLGSAYTGNPMFMQNALMMNQMRDQRLKAEQDERQNQVGNAAAMSFLRTQGLEGTPATKAFEVNGRTYGQNREAAPAQDPLRMLSRFMNGGTPLQSVAAQRAISQLFPQGFSGTLGEGEVAFQNGRQVASGPSKAQDPVRGVVVRNSLVNPIDGSTIREFPVEQGGDETWSNPVSEIGPDGKPISVRYGSRGGRQVVPGATPARQGNSFDRQDYWRGQFKPLLDAATDVGIQSSKVGKALDLNTGTGHIAAINALQKMIDQGAVVRDQDVALIQSAQSFLEQRKGDIERLKSGKLLGPELQKEMRDLAAELERAVYDGTISRIDPYNDAMKTEGVDVRSIVPDAVYSRMAPRTQGNFTMGAMPGVPNTMSAGQSISPIGQTFNIAGATVTRIK